MKNQSTTTQLASLQLSKHWLRLASFGLLCIWLALTLITCTPATVPKPKTEHPQIPTFLLEIYDAFNNNPNHGRALLRQRLQPEQYVGDSIRVLLRPWRSGTNKITTDHFGALGVKIERQYIALMRILVPVPKLIQLADQTPWFKSMELYKPVPAISPGDQLRPRQISILHPVENSITHMPKATVPPTKEAFPFDIFLSGEKVNIYLDGNDITPIAKPFQSCYIPEIEYSFATCTRINFELTGQLKAGKHVTEARFQDKTGKAFQYKWNFYINRDDDSEFNNLLIVASLA